MNSSLIFIYNRKEWYILSIQTILQGQEKQSSKVFYNLSVATTTWVDSATYTSYSKQANIPCSGVTSEYIPTVIFGPDDATGGNFAPVALSGTGIITIYAKETPTTTITIPTIKCDRVVS